VPISLTLDPGKKDRGEWSARRGSAGGGRTLAAGGERSYFLIEKGRGEGGYPTGKMQSSIT